MDYFSFTEVVGYIASAVHLLSFLMKDLTKLRLINLLGCLLFVFYGMLLNYSIPIIVTNSAIAIINIVYLVKTKKDVK